MIKYGSKWAVELIILYIIQGLIFTYGKGCLGRKEATESIYLNGAESCAPSADRATFKFGLQRLQKTLAYDKNRKRVASYHLRRI